MQPFSIGPSPNAPCIFRCSTLSSAWQPTPAGGPTAVTAIGISPTFLPIHRRHLCSFPLWSAFPTALVRRHTHEYYEHSVTLGLAPRRAIPHSLGERRPSAP
jgi:hypothetical protein